jgi:SAM-dependent methyltransferase
MKLLDKLKLPELRDGLSRDDAALTLLHSRIIRRKKFLRQIYLDFYAELAEAVAYSDRKAVLELGSGGGFIKEVLPQVITSDVLNVPTVEKVFSACAMPFEDASLDAIVMVDVLHHIPDMRAFFREAVRCLKVGGRIAMIEPANTCWGRFIYTHFHQETFDPKAGWSFQSIGPLTTANGALPWILFHRDRRQFEAEFGQLRLVKTRCHTPFCYLLSGGLTLRQLLPDRAYPFIKGVEFCLSPLNRVMGMFETILLEKTEITPS